MYYDIFILIGFFSCCRRKLRRAPLDSSLVKKGPTCINKEDVTWVDLDRQFTLAT